MGWRPIKEEKILIRWRCVCDGNSVAGVDPFSDSESYTIELSPSSDTPNCTLCGSEMTYIETLLDCKFDPIRETLVISTRKENDS